MHACSMQMHMAHQWCTSMAMDVFHCFLLHWDAAPQPRGHAALQPCSPCTPDTFMRYATVLMPLCCSHSVTRGLGLEVEMLYQYTRTPLEFPGGGSCCCYPAHPSAADCVQPALERVSLCCALSWTTTLVYQMYDSMLGLLRQVPVVCAVQ